MPDRVERVLYLDSDFYITLGNPALAGLQLEVTPEVPPDGETSRYARFLPEGITVLTDQPLVNAGRKSVYEPTVQLLEIIETETASGRYDWVIIGNNRGSGLIKARRVVESMRDKVLIIANSYPLSEPYRQLGIRHFATRYAAGDILAQMIAAAQLAPSLAAMAADERCSSCGEELVKGECINLDCPMHDRY